MECPVCYCATAKCQLVCGHALCSDCAKSWYQKSDEPNCPMCREPMYFKGMWRLKEDMEEHRYDDQCSDLFSEAAGDIFEDVELELLEFRKTGPSPSTYRLFSKYLMDCLMDDLEDVQKKFSTMLDQEYSIDEMRCVLEGWFFQYRCRQVWDTHRPLDMVVSNYPWIK